MSTALKQALEDYYKTIREERANYRACYKSFLEYCNQELKLYSLADLAENLTKIDVEQACKYYFETSINLGNWLCIGFLLRMDLKKKLLLI